MSASSLFNDHIAPLAGRFDAPEGTGVLKAAEGAAPARVGGTQAPGSLFPSIQEPTNTYAPGQAASPLPEEDSIFGSKALDRVVANDTEPQRSRAPFLAPEGAPAASFTLPSRDSAVSPEGTTDPKGAAFTGTADSSKGITNFVKQFEGFNASAYDDFGQQSIGYGTRAKKGESTISRGEADRRLGAELTTHRNRVLAHNKKHNLKLNANQLDALTSFDYNTGALNQLTAGGKRSAAQIAQKMLLYNKAGGKTLRGLTRRRKAESELFTTKTP
tara:strand:- start:4101 stop:4919 length:819 start_codon:yes stop_codon:yes gene_type:complete